MGKTKKKRWFGRKSKKKKAEYYKDNFDKSIKTKADNIPSKEDIKKGICINYYYNNYVFVFIKNNYICVYNDNDQRDIKIHNDDDSYESDCSYIENIDEDIKHKFFEKNKYKFKKIFISCIDWETDSKHKKQYNTYEYKIKKTTYVFHNLVKRNLRSIGYFILFNTKKNIYYGKSSFFFKFETPDNDEIIYASEGGSLKSGAEDIFAIGKKYTYLFSTWTGNYYIKNEVMKANNEIDPWKFYRRGFKTSSSYEKNKMEKIMDKQLNRFGIGKPRIPAYKLNIEIINTRI